MRYEAPNESSRWDFPLFKVTICEDQADKIEESSTVAASNITSSPPGVDISLESVTISTENVPPSANSPSNDDNTTDIKIAASTPLAAEAAATVVPSMKASSFTSSWKPKKKVNTAGIKADDEGTVFTLSAASAITTATTAKAISFSGTMVVQEDASIRGFLAQDVVLGRISDYFGGAVAPVPNSSTIATQRANADLLYELDRTSQQIIQVIVAHQAEGLVEGTPLKFVEYDRALTLNRHAGLAELQRYRRQYVKINGQHPPTTSKAIGASFIDFLALHL